MSVTIERAYVARLTGRALSAGPQKYQACHSVVGSLYKHQHTLALDLPVKVTQAIESDRMQAQKVQRVIADHLDDIVGRLEGIAAASEDPEGDLLSRNAAWLAADLDLDAVDRELLELVLRYTQIDMLENLVDRLSKALKGIPRALAYLLGLRRTELERRLLFEAALVQSGLVTVNVAGRYVTSLEGYSNDYLEVPSAVRESLQQSFAGPEALRAAVFGSPVRAELDWHDFAHLDADRDLIAGVLGGAATRGTRGVNLLLHGPSGCGKTELCKTVAARLGLTLFPVGEAGPQGGELRRGGRLRALRLMQRLAARRPGTVLLFDEMEDLQPGDVGGYGGSQTRSKVFFNRLLEANPVPVLWTANDVEDFDPAILRRMTLAVEIKLPGARARARLWQRLVRDSDVDCAPEDLRSLAEEVEVAPGLAASALRAAELAGGGLAEVRRAVDGMARVVHGRPLTPAGGEGAPFDFRLVNTDLDLDSLVRRVTRNNDIRAFSLCLNGPPGTGKTAFARHLALAMGLRPLKKRASDLLSKWIGGTEKRIARAFEEAREDEAFLICDEADALLSERAGAERSWELSQVAEMLTWMEAHPLPFCCTTNLVARLDRASLRRFTFKVKFDHLSRAQVGLAFEVFFGLPAPAAVLALANLTPGDFAVVRRKAAILGQAEDARALARMLRAESAAKPDAAKPIGFLGRETDSSTL
jgi:SpoVK/Ycf46/Vps4 family AAA+-type ATPase